MSQDHVYVCYQVKVDLYFIASISGATICLYDIFHVYICIYDFVFIICMFCLHDFKIFSKKENVIFYPLQSLYSAVLNNSKLFFVCIFFIYKSMYHNYIIIPKLHKKES